MYRIYFDIEGITAGVSEFEVEAETLGEVETIALLECRKMMGSKYIMLSHRGDMEYDIMEGMTLVGRVGIRSL